MCLNIRYLAVPALSRSEISGAILGECSSPTVKTRLAESELGHLPEMELRHSAAPRASSPAFLLAEWRRLGRRRCWKSIGMRRRWSGLAS